ncbi:hypothetical protein A2U01_0052219, partial [Trifolium medium]|nr:hypothetical protein [Trifolium medium]
MLVKSANGDKMEFTVEKMLANKVTINFNMLCSFIENVIVDNLNDIDCDYHNKDLLVKIRDDR